MYLSLQINNMERDKVLDTIKELPEEFEPEELIEKLIFIEKIEQGLKQLDEGGNCVTRKSKRNNQQMVNMIWTQVAIEDLRLIHANISKDLEFYADRFVSKIITRVKQL